MDINSSIKIAVRKLSAKNLDAFEVFGVSESSLVIEARRQMVHSIRRKVARGLGVRAVKDGRIGEASTTDIAPQSIERAIGHLLSSLPRIHPSEEAVIAAVPGRAAVLEERRGRALSEIKEDEKIRMALSLESAAVAADSRITRAQHACYEEKTREVIIKNSNGVSASAIRGMAICEIKAIAGEGSEAASAYEFAFSPRFDDLDAEGLAKSAALRAVAKLGGKKAPAGRALALFSPRAAWAFVKLVAPSFFADNVQRGKSRLAGKRGERVYHPQVSIIDDGLLPDGFGSFPFDGEGVQKQRTGMVSNGVVEGWLYDGARAVRDGAASTGNCLREGLNRLPVIGVGNCFLKAGEKMPANLMKSVDRGVFITDLAGTHTANAISGDFSLGFEGMLIEGGEVRGPLRGMTVAGNVHDFLRLVVGIGSDLEFFGAYGAPSVLVEGLMFGS